MSQEQLQVLDDELNRLIRDGRFLEAMERYYAEDAAMQENGDPPTVGKAQNLERERQFWAGVTLHGVEQRSQTVGDGVTTSEWRFDWTIGGVRSALEEVAVRRWRGGRVVAERFYYRPGA